MKMSARAVRRLPREEGVCSFRRALGAWAAHQLQRLRFKRAQRGCRGAPRRLWRTWPRYSRPRDRPSASRCRASRLQVHHRPQQGLRRHIQPRDAPSRKAGCARTARPVRPCPQCDKAIGLPISAQAKRSPGSPFSIWPRNTPEGPYLVSIADLLGGGELRAPISASAACSGCPPRAGARRKLVGPRLHRHRFHRQQK